MANETVSFEITANTENASKAITELQRKLNAMARIETTDKDTKAQQKVFAQMNKDLGEILKKEKDLGRHYTTYASRAKRVEKLTKEYEDQDAVLQKFIARQDELQAKSADGTITPAEVNELSRTTATVNNLTEKQAAQLKKINATKRENEKLDRAGKNVLKQIVDKYGEIKSDESSVLGLKLEQVKGTEQAVASEGELDKEVNKTNSSLDKQAQSAKRAKSEFDKATNKSNRTKNIKQIIGETENIEEQISNIEKRASKVLSQPMAPDKFTFGDLKRRKEELEDVRKAIESIGTPKELDDFYQRLTVELDRVKQGMTALHKETKATNTDNVAGVKQTVDTAEEAEKRLREVSEQANKALVQPSDIGSVGLADVQRRLNELKGAKKAIESIGIPKELDAQYQRLAIEIKKVEQVVGEFNKKAKEPIPSERIRNFQNELQGVIDVTDRMSQKLAVDAGKVGIGELIRRLNELKDAKKVLEDLGLPREMDGRYQMLNEMIARITTQISAYKRSLSEVPEKHKQVEDTGVSFSKNVSEALKTVKSGFKSLNKDIDTDRRHFKSLGSTISKVGNSFDKMAHATKSGFKHMITNITKYVLGFRSLFFLIRRLRKYIGEGIKNLAQFNDGNNAVNHQITRLLSSLLYLKNAWAAAFSPVIIITRDWLPNLIDRMADVGNAVARFIGALTGQEVVFNAVKVDAQDYADSLDNAGGSAGSAADKTKKLTDRLAAFDDLNVLGIDRDPDGTGSGGGGGIADEYIPDPNEMFTIVDAQSKLAEMIRDAWENADFSGLGDLLAQKIIGVLNDLNDKWPTIQANADKIGTSLGTFFAGLFGDPELFNQTATAIGEGINTVTGAIEAFLEQVKDVDFGGNLAQGFNTFLETTDFGQIGENINTAITTFNDNINSFLDTLDTEELSKSISDFIDNLDIPKLLESAGKTSIKLVCTAIEVGADVIDDLSTRLSDRLTLKVSNPIETGITYTDESGNEQTLQITQTYDWTDDPLYALLDNFFIDVGKFFVEGIMGINDLDSLEKFISRWDGFWDPILEALGIIKKDNTEGPAHSSGGGSRGEKAHTTHSGPTGAHHNEMPNFWTRLWNDLWFDPDKMEELDKTYTKVAKTSEKVKGKIKGTNQEITEDTSSTWTNIETTVTTSTDNINTTVPATTEQTGLAVTTTNTNLQTNLSTIWGQIKDSASSEWYATGTTISTNVDDADTEADNSTTNLKTSLINTWQAIKGGIYEKMVGIKTNVVTVFEQLKEAVKGPINGFLGIVEGMINNVIDGVNWLTEKLNSIPDIQFDWQGKSYQIGFTLPSLNHIEVPRLAQGAVIPPNREFMAVLGDQSHGTNIEAPLDTIKQAVAEVLANNGNAEMIQLLQQLITVVENKNLVIGDKDIGRANARYVKQQNIVRGSTF